MIILKWPVVVFIVFGLYCPNAISGNCGKREVSDFFPRISLGTEISKNYWPWLAALIFKSENSDLNEKFFCGATLISLKSALTAAHCMQEKNVEKRLNPSDFEVHLGRHDLSDKGELEDAAKVLEPIIIIAMHPDWNPKNIRYDADLALLIAAKKIESSFFISPICLQDRDITNVKGTIVGWGFSSDEKRKTEDIARQAEAEKVSLVDCFLEDNDLAVIASKRTFCVKGAEGSGPCRGDSGGGFFIKLGDTWFIDGIVSSGLVGPSSNCPSTKHSLFTKISSFTSWIEQGINEEYEVQFTYILKNYTDRFGPRHELTVPDILRRGAFSSTIGHSVDLKVDKLYYRDQDWRYLPNNIGYLFPNLKDLRVFRLKIKSIDRLNFKNMERLEILVLNYVFLEQIPSDCFEDLKKLVHIFIQNATLQRIHANTFIHNPSLELINLNDNQIQPNELRNLENAKVETLWLVQNQLASIPFDAFDGLPNLKIIYLHENKLTTFHKDTFLKNLNLAEFWANDNQLQKLPEGLFRNNEKLSKLYLWGNKITEINATFHSYGRYEFDRNVCISKNFSPSNATELMAMNEELQRQCRRK